MFTKSLEGFREDPSCLNELTGYVESTVFCEIWPDYSLIDKEQKGVMNFSVLKTFLVVTSYVTCYVNFSTAELDRKRKPMEIKENADTLLEIDALRLTLHSYFASTITFDTYFVGISVNHFGINGSCHLKKAEGKTEYHFIKFNIS